MKQILVISYCIFVISSARGKNNNLIGSNAFFATEDKRPASPISATSGSTPKCADGSRPVCGDGSEPSLGQEEERMTPVCRRVLSLLAAELFDRDFKVDYS